jgi:catechol 2,3-dioxygenase-like lactoylglutathione lyase family enzyme
MMLKRIDCVMFRVADVDGAIAFYRDVMGLEPLWREGDMAGLAFPEMASPGVRTELVLHNDAQIPALDVNYKVDDVVAAVAELTAAACRVVAGPFPIAIGQCAVIEDPFGNSLTLVDTTKGLRVNNLA